MIVKNKMVKNKLQTKLESKLSKLGFKKQTNDGVCGKYDVNVSTLPNNKNLLLEVWYECNPDINDKKDFHYVVNFYNVKKECFHNQLIFNTHNDTMFWISALMKCKKNYINELIEMIERVNSLESL